MHHIAWIETIEMKLLAAADALMSLSGHRRQQVWDASALRSTPELLRDAPVDEEILDLPSAPEGEELVFDHASLGLKLRSHPMALLRPHLAYRCVLTSADLNATPNGRLVRYCGIVTLRQQPETANGTVFISLEDETGVVQVICWKSLRDAQRKDLLRFRLLVVHGKWQREGNVKNLIAGKLEDLTPSVGQAGDGEPRLQVTARSRIITGAQELQEASLVHGSRQCLPTLEFGQSSNDPGRLCLVDR
ncbi:MAG: hypothetical protein JF606_03210 [Burkholderiales bacterium]|jgi:error-prone DNA polymerase|nr:hypothetical protein [Burkholderiales bacterium]